MHDFLNDMPLLVEIARQKSFTRAADILEMGASTLSRRIRLLEERMGVLLFYRDTRNVELTENGALLLERCEFILTETRKAHDAVVLNMGRASGLIRICMFADTYSPLLEKALSDFAASWPDIQIRLTFAEHPVDLRTDPYDVAFLIGPAIAAPLIARKLLAIEPFLYASPKLFTRYPQPVVPQDVYGIPCIVLDRFGSQWILDNGERQVPLAVEPRYTFSSIELCHRFAVAGHGVALLRGELGQADEEAGRLVRVLPGWSGPRHSLNLVTGPGQLPQRVRLFVEHIQECYAAV